MEMSTIESCSQESCSYNESSDCTTLAINVGPHAECATYVNSGLDGGVNGSTPGVGACVATDCRYNEDLECVTPNISVGSHEIHADCLTYEGRG